MATKQRGSKVAPMYKLDTKPYTDMVRRAGELAERALERYREPTMSVEELRAMVDGELPGVSLSELILKERRAGW